MSTADRWISLISIIMKQEGELKVYSYALPHCQRFSQREFKTVGQFQNKLQQWFGIPIKQQKLLKDKRIVDFWLTSPFSSLKLTPATHLVVLTKSPHAKRIKIVEEKMKVETSLVESVMEVSHAHQSITQPELSRQSNELASVKLLSCLKEAAINEIITRFIKGIEIPNAELLLLDDPRLRFIIQKITAHNPILQEMLISRLFIVKLALIDESRLRSVKEIASTAPPEAITYLTKLNFAEGDAIRALQLGKNHLYTALRILCKGSSDLEHEKFQAKWGSAIEEFQSISKWLQQQSNKHVVLYLKNSPNELQVFINYWKHTCPQLHQMIQRWRSYIGSLIDYHYRKIKL